MSDAVITNETTFWRGGTASTDAFSKIAEVVDIDPPAGESAEVDVTHLESLAREFKLGLRDNGQTTLTMNLIPGSVQQEAIEDDQDSGTIRYYKIVFRDGVNGRAFKAGVKQFKVAAIAVDGALRATVVFRNSGAVTRLPTLPA
jgi:hypothetical protein